MKLHNIFTAKAQSQNNYSLVYNKKTGQTLKSALFISIKIIVLFILFTPAVPEGNRAVENRFSGSRIFINTEIT